MNASLRSSRQLTVRLNSSRASATRCRLWDTKHGAMLTSSDSQYLLCCTMGRLLQLADLA